MTKSSTLLFLPGSPEEIERIFGEIEEALRGYHFAVDLWDSENPKHWDADNLFSTSAEEWYKAREGVKDLFEDEIAQADVIGLQIQEMLEKRWKSDVLFAYQSIIDMLPNDHDLDGRINGLHFTGNENLLKKIAGQPIERYHPGINIEILFFWSIFCRTN